MFQNNSLDKNIYLQVQFTARLQAVCSSWSPICSGKRPAYSISLNNNSECTELTQYIKYNWSFFETNYRIRQFCFVIQFKKEVKVSRTSVVTTALKFTQTETPSSKPSWPELRHGTQSEPSRPDYRRLRSFGRPFVHDPTTYLPFFFFFQE